VAHESADVWTNPDQFKLNQDGSPVVVAGVPPDYFSATGQLWGNPLYNWDQMRADGFKWWIERVYAHAAHNGHCAHRSFFAALRRVGKFLAETRRPNAGAGSRPPGRELFTAIRRALGELPIIAEDLGVITPPDVEALRDDFGFPGMRILRLLSVVTQRITTCRTTIIAMWLSTQELTTTTQLWAGFRAWPVKDRRARLNKSRASELLHAVLEH